MLHLAKRSISLISHAEQKYPVLEVTSSKVMALGSTKQCCGSRWTVLWQKDGHSFHRRFLQRTNVLWGRGSSRALINPIFTPLADRSRKVAQSRPMASILLVHPRSRSRVTP